MSNDPTPGARYEDCDRCGERYYGEFIDAYLRTEEKRNEVIRVCCFPEGEPRAPLLGARIDQ